MMSVVDDIPANLDENDDENLRGSKKSGQSSIKMFHIGKELCFLLLIVFTTYASFNSSNTGSGPPAIPFFPRGSLVGDFYKGELADALLRASEGDVSFVMYYAPWDAESQAARTHFEAVAHQYYKQIYFVGINCWQPRSDCRRTLSKIQQFPKLVAYVTHETGVEYRGPRTLPYMTAFLDTVMRPLHRLHSLEELSRLRSSYNAVVVAFVNFYGMRGGLPYRAMYETALKFLEREVRQEVAFAVVTSFKTTLDMGANRTPLIRLYLWNETLDYPGHYASDRLTEWVVSGIHQVSLWLSPPGVKSLTLAPYVTQSPALVMFTPFDNFVMYHLLREVGLEYYNCHNLSAVSELAQNISQHVSERISVSRRTMLSCQSRSLDLLPTVQVVSGKWTNTSCAGRPCPTLTQCTKPTPRLTSVVTADHDPLSAGALAEWAWRERCSGLVPPPARLPATPLAPGLRGLACRYNQSISLLALDSLLFSHLAQGLGVDTELAKDRTKVLLLNSQMETTHVLDEPVTRASLSQFLVNFTEGRLARHHRTQPVTPPLPVLTPTTSPVRMSLTELTADTFLPVAFNDSQNVVVFFYTPYCAFCHAVSHVYLSVARLLHAIPSLLFTRLDGENNDLPWQFTAPHYPSILFFPARRKAESRVFGAKARVTVDSLTQFVLSNLPLELRLVAMLQLCHQYPTGQFEGRRRECLVEVRREVLEAISTQLQRYRSLSLHMASSRLKRAAMGKVVTRLQHLKQLQFSLSVDSPNLASHWLSQILDKSSSAYDTRPSEDSRVDDKSSPLHISPKDEL